MLPCCPMKRSFVVVSVLFIATIPLSAMAESESAATVTEAVNDVTRGSSAVAGTEVARIGSKLEDGQYLKTGVKSRAELELANLAITRLGADTIFDYSPGANQIDLQSGTVLFSKPKDSAQMTIKTAAVTAAVMGTTGFVQVHGKVFIFGLVEGHARVTVGGVTYSVGPGDILHFSPGAPPQMFAYNVPHFLETSPLIVDFSSKLPNQAYIDQEVAQYDNLVARGFITPPTGEPLPGMEGTIPVIPPTSSTVPSLDVANQAYTAGSMPGAPPPMRSNVDFARRP
jgi:mannose-6-phosphate isomerase-like protein (cupin superfamily)